MSTTNDTTLASSSSTCTNCGKEGENTNICNKCMTTTYCNAVCKKKHRSKHKEACERRVAELHEEELERERRAVELHEEALFKQPPPPEDCPICILPLPSLITGSKYRACCGKIICSGCIHAVAGMVVHYMISALKSCKVGIYINKRHLVWSRYKHKHTEHKDGYIQ